MSSADSFHCGLARKLSYTALIRVSPLETRPDGCMDDVPTLQQDGPMTLSAGSEPLDASW